MNTKLEQILPKMRCPLCGEKLQLQIDKVEKDEVVEGSLFCQDSHIFGIHAGVADFGSEEKDGINAWSDYLKSIDMDELDKEIENSKSAKEKKEQLKLLEALSRRTCEEKPSLVIDIASGRGMLLEKLLSADSIDLPFTLVATDLSFEIMAKDRLKFKKLFPDKSLVYIACDATNLPFEDDTADAVVSFFGIANMFELMEKGISEASRVMKSSGNLFNAYIDIKEDSKGFATVADICHRQNMEDAEKVFLFEEIKRVHEKYFAELEVDTVTESIYENADNKLDLLPYPGEWYAYRIYAGKKELLKNPQIDVNSRLKSI